MTVRQKLGMILEKKSVSKIEVIKKIILANVPSTLLLLTEKKSSNFLSVQ